MRKKSINLVLLIFITLAILALIIVLIYLANHSKNVKEDSETSNDTTSYIQENSVASSLQNNEVQSSDQNIDEFLNGFDDIENVEVEDISQGESTLILNNHTYKFDDSINASIIENSSNKSELQLKYLNYNFNMAFNTDSEISFEELKNESSLNDYIESNYNVTITSSIKYGSIKNLDLIMCTISDDNGQAYLVITPLNDSEIAYVKIYNANDSQVLLDNLSYPVSAISSIISNVK